MPVFGKLRKLISIQHRKFFRNTLDTIISIILHFHFLRLPLFGCDNNYTIRSTTTINSCRRSIFQNFYRFNIIIIQIGKSTFHRYTVDNIERITTCIHCADTTNTDTYASFRITTRLRNLYSRHFSRQRLTKIGSGNFCYLFGFHGRNRSRNISFSLNTIAYHDYFIDHLTIFHQRDFCRILIFCRDIHSFIADIRNSQCGRFRYIHD